MCPRRDPLLAPVPESRAFLRDAPPSDPEKLVIYVRPDVWRWLRGRPPGSRMKHQVDLATQAEPRDGQRVEITSAAEPVARLGRIVERRRATGSVLWVSIEVAGYASLP